MERKSRLFFWILIACFLCPLSAHPSNRPQSEGETIRVSRLVGLCKLWGYVKYFHPSLAYRSDIDWDAALVATIPKVRDASTVEEYAAALQRLLDPLGDSLTRVVKISSPATVQAKGESQQFGYRLTEDRVLTITVGNYFELSNPANQEKLRAVVNEIPKARAIVFDLRSPEPVGDYGKFQLAANFSQLERLISTAAIITPGEHRRVHYGFESNSPFSSGQYKSGFFTRDGKRITPAQNAKDISSVFILNKNSGLLPSIPALQASERGLIIFEGDGAIGATHTLDLGEGLLAQVRVSELIYADGTSGDVQPDVIVTASQSETDKAMEAALGLARNFKSSTVVRKKLAGSAAPIVDKSYLQMKHPTLEYRLLAAFRIWNIFEYFFPYKHLMGEDWDAVLREFIPQFERAKDALEYSLTVAEMVTHVHDSHAYVSGTVLNNEFFGSGFPPIRVRIIENTPVITSLTNGIAAKSAGAEIGDIVLKVEGEDAKVRVARFARYLSASTPQSKFDKASLYFLSGRVNSVVTLTIRDGANREKEVKLNRKFEDFTTLFHKERSGDIIKLLPGNIGYADLDRLTGAMIDEMFERFRNTKAIIFDMRGYPNSTVWWLAPRLTEKKEVAAAFFETPIVGHSSSTRFSEAFYQMVLPAPPGKWTYKGKTVMLIDERTMSQAEHTGLFLRAANGTKFIGSPTAGANGEITTFSVPGGIAIGFTGQSVKWPDGRQLQRIGLVPDIEVKPTVKGIRAGRDEVLDRAIRYLSEGPN